MTDLVIPLRVTIELELAMLNLEHLQGRAQDCAPLPAKHG